MPDYEIKPQDMSHDELIASYKELKAINAKLGQILTRCAQRQREIERLKSDLARTQRKVKRLQNA